MKKKFAKWLMLLAKAIDPQTHIVNAQHIEDFEPKKLGLTCVVSKNDVKKYRADLNLSVRDGDRKIVRDAKERVAQSIYMAIEKNHLIEYDVKREDGGFSVSGFLRVYIRSAESN